MRVRCQVGISSNAKNAVRPTQRPMRVRFQVGRAAPGPDEGAARVTHGAVAEASRRAVSPLASPHATRSRLPVKAKADATQASRFKRGAIAAAVLITAAGCASLDPIQALAWKVQPVMNVSHALQSSEDYYRLGRYYDGSQRWDRSIEAYGKAIAIDSRNVQAYNALGVALSQRNRHDEAQAMFRKALSIDPGQAHVWNNLGYVLLLAGNPRDAITALKTAVRLDRDNATARSNLREAVAQWELAQQGGSGGVAESRASNGEPVVTALAPATPEAALKAHASGAPQAAPVRADAPVVISVPAPITVASVPAPLTVAISVTAPSSQSVAPTRRAPYVIDEPTMSSLQAAPGRAPDVREVRVPQAALHPVAVKPQPVFMEGRNGQLELSNGNGVTGAAARLREWLSGQGVRTTRLTNQRPYVQQYTVIQYRSGQEEAAQRVARTLRMTVQPDPTPNEKLRTDVRVVLGHDWARTASCLERDTCTGPEKVAAALPHPR